MPQNFLSCDRDQPMLLPPDLRDWLDTFASLHLARGTNVLRVSRLLGHHSAEFTLRVYGHLIPGDEAPALDLDAELEPCETGGPGPGGATERVGRVHA